MDESATANQLYYALVDCDTEEDGVQANKSKQDNQWMDARGNATRKSIHDLGMRVAE